MNVSFPIQPDQEASQQLGACPFLGVKDDPQTRLDYASLANCCHRVIPAQTVEFSHQKDFCLSQNYPACRVYVEPAHSKKLRGAHPAEFHARAQEDGSNEDPQAGLNDWYKDLQPANKEPRRNWVMIGTALVVSILIFGGFSIFNQWRSSIRQASSAALATSIDETIGRTATASAVSTQNLMQATLTQVAFLIGRPTASPTPSPSPTATPVPPTYTSPPPTATIISTPSATATEVVVASCDDIVAYRMALISGPALSPELGYIYNVGELPPVVLSDWTLKNDGPCEINQVALYSLTTSRMFAPILKKDGNTIKISSPDDSAMIAPGDVFDVILSFLPTQARYVTGEWVLVVNGFRLQDQPHLTMDAQNWVIVSSPDTGPANTAKPPGPGKKPSATQPPSSPPEAPTPSR
jgi:hypothetical protein